MKHLDAMQEHLVAIEDLRDHFSAYQYSYCKLVAELARRKQYKDTIAKFVQSVASQLTVMVEGIL